jgi:hypothetical protein
MLTVVAVAKRPIGRLTSASHHTAGRLDSV